jgi:hypothetical protein
VLHPPGRLWCWIGCCFAEMKRAVSGNEKALDTDDGNVCGQCRGPVRGRKRVRAKGVVWCVALSQGSGGLEIGQVQRSTLGT